VISSGCQTYQHHSSGRSVHSFRTLTLYREGSIQIASVRTFQQHVWTLLNSRTVSDSYQVPRKGRSINRSDYVVSRQDACLLKARIAIQISPSGRLTALVRTRVHQRRKLPIRLQPSGRLSLMVRTRAMEIWKLLVEELPSERSSPMIRTCETLYGNYLQWTCYSPNDVPSRPDEALKQERFPCEIFKKSCRTVVHPDNPYPPSGRHPAIFCLTLI
jgi:hypothetical protein